MTASLRDILEQAKALSPAERAELAKLLIDTLETTDAPSEPAEHWGKSLNRLLDELGPIELVDSHIEDPVEWVRVQREKERQHRLGDWSE
ncbi:MAG: hypothetical protein SF029_10215 [bacterium]|nr:hypothetical protein [bacterium]